jgi:dTMP kinase
MCKVIVFEGIDRLGKTTQTKMLVEYLKSQGKRVTYIKSPYNEGVTFPLIYWMLRTGWARRVPNVFQVVHFVNKMYFQYFKLPTLLKTNDFIVLDRWAASMWAYGIADDANVDFTNFLVRKTFEPDLTVMMDGTPFKRDEAEDSYESDKGYQKRVQGLYRTWGLPNGCCIAEINANQPVQTVFQDVLQNLTNRNWI